MYSSSNSILGSTKHEQSHWRTSQHLVEFCRVYLDGTSTRPKHGKHERGTPLGGFNIRRYGCPLPHIWGLPFPRHRLFIHLWQPRRGNPRLRPGSVGQRLRAPGPRRPREGARGAGAPAEKLLAGQGLHRGVGEMAGRGAAAPLAGRPKTEGGDGRGAAERGRFRRRGGGVGGRRGGGVRGLREAAVLHVQVGGAPVRPSWVLGAREGVGRGRVFVLGVDCIPCLETDFACLTRRDLLGMALKGGRRRGGGGLPWHWRPLLWWIGRRGKLVGGVVLCSGDCGDCSRCRFGN